MTRTHVRDYEVLQEPPLPFSHLNPLAEMSVRGREANVRGKGVD